MIVAGVILTCVVAVLWLADSGSKHFRYGIAGLVVGVIAMALFVTADLIAPHKGEGSHAPLVDDPARKSAP